jgi:hypothetical protein
MNDWRTIAALVFALSLILVGMDRAQGVITLLAERGAGGGQTWE